MIRFSSFGFRYEPNSPWIVRDLDVEVLDGELLVVIGPTGSGKSTVLRAIDGLIPHFSGGEMLGDVTIAGHSIREATPTDLAGIVGYVGQNPVQSFVTDRVEDEIAYAMENLGITAVTMRRRVEDVLDVLNLHEVRNEQLRSLSGGQQQRVAIAAVLAASPRVLVLDEPTSALDPGSAEEVLSALTRLVHDVGLTVVIAEHRLERVLPFADRVMALTPEGVTLGRPADIMEHSRIAPPIVELGRIAQWKPLPVSVREARRMAGPLFERLAPLRPPPAVAVTGSTVATMNVVSLRYGQTPALVNVSWDLAGGTITALMGRNGSGKTSLLNLLSGMRAPSAGTLLVDGHDPKSMKASERIASVGLVPQDPGTLLYCQSVAQECETADREHGLAAGSTWAELEKLDAVIEASRHPRDLSEGQRLQLALAVVLAARPNLLLLDEPTRGLDYQAKWSLCCQLTGLRDQGVAILLSTHDVELAASIADHTVVLAGGEIIAGGETRDVVRQTPAFAPQVSKVLSPEPWLSVHEIRAALEASS
jgi:energy-coupling factor transport system ATP-binding protein